MLFCFPYTDLLHIYEENKKTDDNKNITKQQEILQLHEEQKDSFGCVCMTKQEAKIFNLLSSIPSK